MKGKVPEDVKPFYDRFNTDDVANPDEANAAKKLADDEAAKKKVKVNKKEIKKNNAKKKKAGDDEGGGKEDLKLGTSEVITKFDDFYDEWKLEWDQKDETNNQEQKHDIAKTKEIVMPDLQAQFKNDVDEMIKIELENMRILSGAKQKKKKGKKKSKKKKKRKKGGPKLPGFK